MERADLERFWKFIRVNLETGCWEWTGYLDYLGYARFMIKGKRSQVHRLSYEHYVGPIAPGMEIDHICSVKYCVNREHLQQVTQVENANLAVKRKENYNSAKTHCKYGHAFTEENTYYYKRAYSGKPMRFCRACWERKRRKYKK